MLSKELLRVLACPECKAEVKELQEDKLVLCESCQREFPIVNDIPIMLLEESVLRQATSQ